MSGAIMQATQADVDALMARLERAKKRIDALSSPDEKPPFWNSRYVIDFAWGNVGEPYDEQHPNDESLVLPQAIEHATVADGTTFFVKGMDQSYEATGTLIEDGSAGTIVIPESQRAKVFDYTWRPRDTGTDRDWSNLPLPSSVLRSGNVNGMAFGRGQARLRSGVKIVITVNATYYGALPQVTGMSAITNHKLQISLHGVSVRNEVLGAYVDAMTRRSA